MIYHKLLEATGEEYMLRQLAEENCELAQASLKLVRAMNGETPMSIADARAAFLEEYADVLLMTTIFMSADIISDEESVDVENAMTNKLDRFCRRVLNKNQSPAN